MGIPNVDVLKRALEEGMGLTFDDVLLVPGMSDVVPRDVDVKTRLSRNIPLKIPFVSADMDTVTEAKMAIELAKEGGIGFIWKFPDIERQEDEVSKVKYKLNKRIDKPICIREDKTVGDLEEILRKYENGFSSLVVLNAEQRVVGLLTRDKYQFAKRTTHVRDVMVRNPLTSQEDLDVKQAYDFMKTRGVAKVILVDSDGKLRGLYCWKDVREIIENATPLYNRDGGGQLRVGANIGVNDFERAERLLRRKCDVLLVGTAHGHSGNVIKTVKELRTQFTRYTFDIVAGNVATYEAARVLFEAGADGVKVGVGPGSICTTRITTGAGAAQLSAIYECALAGAEFDLPIIGDGGIRFSGDVTKALAAGASSVMIGNLFAATDEASGETIMLNGIKYKVYRGMGSLDAMSAHKSARARYAQEGAEKLVPEGVKTRAPLKGPVRDVLYQLVGGLRSGMGYVGARTIQELQTKRRFRRVTSEGVIESHPHDVTIMGETHNYGGGGG